MKTRATTTANEPDCGSVQFGFSFFPVQWTGPSNTTCIYFTRVNKTSVITGYVTRFCQDSVDLC